MHLALTSVQRLARRYALPPVAVATFALSPVAVAQEAPAWLNRVVGAARTLNYVGTIVYQQGGNVETSRIVHAADRGEEREKLVNLDGPAREVIRNQDEVRCYYPDLKVVRVEPRSFSNAFPSLSPVQMKSLTQYYTFRKAEATRIAGIPAQAYVFEPRDAFRYAHKFWSDPATGLLLKARLIDENDQVIEQFAFLELSVGTRIDPELVRPSWPSTPPDWQVRQGPSGQTEPADTGWTVTRLPAGFTKVVEGWRQSKARRRTMAHLVYSDGLVAVSVFIEPAASAGVHAGYRQQGGLNVYSVRHDDQLVTALGETPSATVRQIAMSVARR